MGLEGNSPERRAQKNESVEREEKEIIVEVGGGVMPLIFRPPEDYAKSFKENPRVHYIGVEWNAKDLSTSRDSIAATSGIPERVHFVRADGQRLPFDRDSVSEVIFVNVLGDQHTLSPEGLLDEATRVLKQGGILKIVETLSPEVALRPGGAVEYLRTAISSALEETPEENARTPINETNLNKKIMGEPVGSQERFIIYFRKKI